MPMLLMAFIIIHVSSYIMYMKINKITSPKMNISTPLFLIALEISPWFGFIVSINLKILIFIYYLCKFINTNNRIKQYRITIQCYSDNFILIQTLENLQELFNLSKTLQNSLRILKWTREQVKFNFKIHNNQDSKF